MHSDGLASGYPRLISDEWPGVPSDIDAATANRKGTMYFLKGDRYWTYGAIGKSAHVKGERYWSYGANRKSVRKSAISVGWPGIPANVDGATWGGDSIFYFFKGKLHVI
jgi:hypothetical protein